MELTQMQRDTIERIRRTKDESQLSISDIMDMLADKGYHQLTESTVKRLFNRNSDPMSFKYRTTVVPLADVLLDMYSDNSNSEDVAALKAMVRDKNKTIEILVDKCEDLKAEYEKRIAHLKKQVTELNDHLMFRERMIDKKDGIIDKLLNAYIESNSKA